MWLQKLKIKWETEIMQKNEITREMNQLDTREGKNVDVAIEIKERVTFPSGPRAGPQQGPCHAALGPAADDVMPILFQTTCCNILECAFPCAASLCKTMFPTRKT